MDLETAREIIGTPERSKPSEIAKAVDVLYQEFGTYQAITEEIGRSEKFWIIRHRIFQLPIGIQWKIDEGAIRIEQGYQISRLKQEEDQWLLAIAIIESKGLTAKKCSRIVNLVLKEGRSIRDSLGILADIQFDKIQELLLSIEPNIWVLICKVAWERCQKWEDFCYQSVLQGIDVDLLEIASQLDELALDLRGAGRD